MPLLLALSAVLATMGLVALPSHIFPIDDAAASVILLIGMAVGVDYSLFYMRREREERAKGHDPPTALQRAAATSGRAVLVSGLTVMAAMAGMFLSGDKGFIGMGLGAMIVVGVAMVGSLTVLPAMLVVARRPRREGPRAVRGAPRATPVASRGCGPRSSTASCGARWCPRSSRRRRWWRWHDPGLRDEDEGHGRRPTSRRTWPS